MQMADDDVVRYLPQFSLSSLDEIHSVITEHELAPEKRAAQRVLATEMTSLVHGVSAASNAEAAADILFGADPTSASQDALLAVASEVPTTVVSTSDLDDPIALLVRAGVATSNSDARRTIQQKGLKVNGQALEEGETLASKGILHDRWVLIRKGKTTYHLFELTA
jgi:tyrosyl-tRNA synthetase